MHYRQSELLAATSITTAGTETVDINVSDVITRLSVIVRLTNNSWTPTGHPAITVIQLDLVDGSDVLHSLRGSYSQAVAFYGTKLQPFNYMNFTDNGLAVAVIPIYFGRYLYDEQLAFDPKKFTNPQLKIQHNYALGGAAPDAATLEVWADMFDEKVVTPNGFLSAKSQWTKTLVASTTDYVDLPTDYPIRLVMPAAFSNSEEPDINIDNVKITEDHDKRTLFEAGTLEMLQMFEANWPEWIEHSEGRTLAGTDISFFFTPCKDLLINPQTSQDSDTYINWVWSGGNKQILNGAATVTIVTSSKGRCPHGVIPIPMGKLMEIDDWWDVTNLGSARIKMVTGAGDTSALYELLTQQYRMY